MSVRRLVEDSIRAGLAGVRIDDQDIETKRGTTHAGITVAPLEIVLARYRAAVDCARELTRGPVGELDGCVARRPELALRSGSREHLRDAAADQR